MKTRIVVICGSPGSGKSTLAISLARQLGVPLIAKDHFKEALMEAMPPADRAASARIGRLSIAAMYAALDALIGVVPAVLVESNFIQQYATGRLLPRLQRGESRILYCTADRKTILQRIRARANDPARHAGHFDQDAIPDILRLLDEDAYRLDLPDTPLTVIDTTSGYAPDMESIIDVLSRDTPHSTR